MYIEQRNSIGSSHKTTCIWSIDSQQICKKNSMRKEMFTNKIVLGKFNKC